jgi:hypothetical protein
VQYSGLFDHDFVRFGLRFHWLAVESQPRGSLVAEILERTSPVVDELSDNRRDASAKETAFNIHKVMYVNC